MSVSLMYKLEPNSFKDVSEQIDEKFGDVKGEEGKNAMKRTLSRSEEKVEDGIDTESNLYSCSDLFISTGLLQ